MHAQPESGNDPIRKAPDGVTLQHRCLARLADFSGQAQGLPTHAAPDPRNWPCAVAPLLTACGARSQTT